MKQTRYILLLGLSILVACKSSDGNNEKLEQQLIGKWEVAEAFRNGNVTESLDDLFFEFFDDGKMRTNLLGSSMQSNYEVEDQAVHQESDEGVVVDYSIEEISDTSLVLSTALRRYNFKFNLKRALEVE